MGERIEFPKPEERLLQLAEKAYSEKDYLKAYGYYQELEDLHPSFQHNKQVVQCLQQMGEFTQAIEKADAYLDDYLFDSEGFVQIGHLLILDSAYFRGRKWVQLAEKHATVNPETIEKLTVELTKVEEVQQIIGGVDFSEKKHVLQEMDRNNQPINSRTWQSLLHGLTKQQFLVLMRELLGQFTNPFLLPKLIEELVQLQSTETFEVIDYMGERRQIIPAKLQPLKEMPAWSQMQHSVEELIGQEDPILAESILEELKDHFTLSYPFLPAVQEIDQWVQSYIEEYRSLLTGTMTQMVDDEIQLKKLKLRQILATI